MKVYHLFFILFVTCGRPLYSSTIDSQVPIELSLNSEDFFHKDQILYTNIVGIIANLFHLLADRHNTLEAKNTMQNIIGGLFNIAAVMTRDGTQEECSEELIKALIEALQLYEISLGN